MAHVGEGVGVGVQVDADRHAVGLGGLSGVDAVISFAGEDSASLLVD
jgi:hypothetical protein